MQNYVLWNLVWRENILIPMSNYTQRAISIEMSKKFTKNIYDFIRILFYSDT